MMTEQRTKPAKDSDDEHGKILDGSLSPGLDSNQITVNRNSFADSSSPMKFRKDTLDLNPDNLEFDDADFNAIFKNKTRSFFNTRPLNQANQILQEKLK